MAQEGTTATRRIRMGLIGLGAAGQNHLAVLSRLPEVDLVGIADLDAALVARLGAETGVALATTDHRRILADTSIEAVAIAAADAAHFPLIMDCAAAG